jgi:hypothetical protein
MAMREKDRKLRRRQRRVRKLRTLKKKLAEAKTTDTKRKLVEKIQRLQPWYEEGE